MRKILLADSSSVVLSIEKQILSKSGTLCPVGEVHSQQEIEKFIKTNEVNGIIVEWNILSVKSHLYIDEVFEVCKSFNVPVILFVPSDFVNTRSPDGISLMVKPNFLSLNEKNFGSVVASFENGFSKSQQSILFRNSIVKKTVQDIVPEQQLGQVQAVVVGVSTGGPLALQTLLTGLGNSFPVPIFITQHVDAFFDKKLISWLNQVSGLTVKIAEQYEIPQPNHVYFAPANKHLVFRKNIKGQCVMILDDGPEVNFLKPAIDVMFESACDIYSNHLIGVILTGMGADGAKGSCKIKQKGGFTITQTEETCAVYGMPKACVEEGGSCEQLPLEKIAVRLKKLVS